ncbi:S-adenosylmethionine/tRNA-ribosyltransferase-isomerase [Sulfurihydrogenibium sp. YO3AOP1]|uniref:S-adenosylmethionine:tRNA ribosyltransferase-isomerase n=1 Tax=Sulfurihydrogenibium sp. (strain YO3AOP1) TaxID=436114 RepID=QUEA_SULSY|nr:tRNA preQ1(34) S-adenosylmethionine ribosyltransferase-isomerase QueA [Sulfurihydrogenibium sp. YO3AOP1]B2V7F8.1 RecName: Full=S-adenosylmethionine:tRNA ribosyltransferase-isomerase; AltName: Full=Queuosine biosynthesis protein QueA [Sulfurihydrogenibium sp. YO3AOP1]ACD65881.1 S-adenosylmethionine/tRNA-ribosyltransferase-isomerase [Sulfurihydrogenibium sp. YO3AOP1]
MKLSDFDYHLPKELIAKYPAQPRDSCRLMVLNRKDKTIEHRIFRDVIDYLKPGDTLVLNNTKVIPARLIGKKEKTNANIEVFLLRPIEDNIWETLIKNVRRLKKNQKIIISDDFYVEFLSKDDEKAIVKIHSKDIKSDLEKYGHVPLPPYIEREDEEKDKDYYQTVFADKEGSVASPTAGLHFTKELLEKIKEKGVNIAYITLHVGLGTFKPVKTEDITKHKMHEEYFTIPKETLEMIKKTKENKKSLVAVGTTVVRALETYGKFGKTEGFTDIFIYPPYEFKIVDKLITNFHLPKSTLLMLVSAFADRDFILRAYNGAVKEKYRFFSYGDAMLIV